MPTFFLVHTQFQPPQFKHIMSNQVNFNRYRTSCSGKLFESSAEVVCEREEEKENKEGKRWANQGH